MTNYLTQPFGANNACISLDGSRRVIAKVNGTCPVGYMGLYESMGMKGHSGEDWILYRGEPIHFCAEFVGWMKTEIDPDGGIGVDVISNEPIFNGNHLKLRFWHLEKVNGHDKKQVRLGDVIGYGDSTGLSSGDHLHWSVKPCDKNGNSVDSNNGFYGARPFEDIFEMHTDVFALDVVVDRAVKPSPADTPQEIQKKSLIESLRRFINQLHLAVRLWQLRQRK